jgi:hypothetical protein
MAHGGLLVSIIFVLLLGASGVGMFCMTSWESGIEQARRRTTYG